MITALQTPLTSPLRPRVLLCALLCALSAALVGCPDTVRVVDLGPPTGGEGGVSAGVMLGGGGAEETGCSADDECARGSFCDFDEDTLTGVCAEGCRVEPDTCAVAGSNKRCDPATHTCVLSCEGDDGCFEGEYCNAEGRCEEGCRLDDPTSCPSTAQGPGLCDPNTRACVVGAVCCDLNDACSISDAELCYATGGEALEGLLSCEPDPCGALCNLDGLCAESEYCSAYGRCAEGCRLNDPEGCPPNLACDPERRRCEARACSSDEACPAWQYCDTEGNVEGETSGEGLCRDGCREGGCTDGLTCDASHVCREACTSDEECPSGYCDEANERCRVSCDPVTHQGCGQGEACLEGRCVVGCADDPFDLAGDDSAEVAPELSWVEGQVGAPRSSGTQERALCVGDEDWVAVTLAVGERVEVRLGARPSSGDLTATLYSPSGAVVAQSADPWAERQRLAYPPLGEGVSEPGRYTLKISSATPLEDHPYSLIVRAAPLAEGCFSDELDPSDDTLRGARALGLTPSLRFTEVAEGSLCFGDVDVMCFPMSVSDGLSLVLDAPPSCDPLNVRLSTSARVETAYDERFDYTSSPSSEQGSLGGARYTLSLEAERDAFTNDLWCAQVSAEGSLGCEGYTLAATFTRGQLVCTDLREPNNVLTQATQLDGAGPLADGTGEVPYDLDAPLSDPLYLCPGERDLFKVQARAGDAWRAWIIDDSDPEGAPQDRGQRVGELRVRFVDANGQRVGDSALINAPAEGEQGEQVEVTQVATAITTLTTPLYVQVEGVSTESEGPYTLALRRVAPTGPCSQDVNEPPGRDDELNPASTLRQEAPQRLSVNNGLLCEPEGGADEDWYRFSLAQSNTRLCLNSSFRHSAGNVDVELFELGDPTAGQACNTHADCRANEPNSSCVANRCRAALARASSVNDGEMINLSSASTRAGEYFARVYSPEGAENAYQLSVSLAPPSSTCDPDFREGEEDNNSPQRPTPLGSGYTRVCDAWVCETERVEGDWYEVVVPAGAQRTLHVSFESQQGRLAFSAEDASSLNGQIVDSPRSPSRNVHCVNVIAGARPATLKLQVSGDTFNVGQRRVDYTLSVAPVNLNANPRGACDSLSGGLFGEVSWPTLDLRTP